MQPATKYARSGGHSLAYCVFGEGPIDFLIVSGFIGHIEHAWKEPSLSRFLSKLAAFSRVIMFDKHGTGLSDALPAANAPSLGERVDDIEAVLDAAASHRAVVFGWSEGGLSAIAFAHRSPQQTVALILFGAAARTPLASVYSGGLADVQARALIDAWEYEWGTPFGLELMAPSVSAEPQMREWWATCQRLTGGPGTMLGLLSAMLDFDGTDLLGQISTPTLVMHATDDALIPVAAGRDIASRVPGARLVVLPGADHVYWLGDQNARLASIRSFLAGLPDGRTIRVRERRGRPRFGWESLTPAELDVVWLVSQGMTNPDIARRLYLSPRTVQTHLKHIFTKLGASRRSEVAAEATRQQMRA
jgi:pimeloyl-ACP methyl ester carboxylesterase/DNA-binding CsgD family transcriptional regulator